MGMPNETNFTEYGKVEPETQEVNENQKTEVEPETEK